MTIGARSSFVRRALFRAFNGVYFRRTFGTSAGFFRAYVSPSSRLQFLDPRPLRIEEVHQRFINRWVKLDSIVWDIGANLGLFAFAAAQRARDGFIYGFEPDPELLCVLHRSRFRLGASSRNTAFFCLAVADRDGVAEFQISKYSRALNKLQIVGPWREDQVEVRTCVTSLMVSVDKLAAVLRPPTIMKIDVEGAELKVLAGARETILRYRPAILIECRHELSNPIREFFVSCDYALFDGGSKDLRPVDTPVWDTIAVSRSTAEGD
jgi:FkbM family methyltransferase